MKHTLVYHSLFLPLYPRAAWPFPTEEVTD
jgi:hypothetical protein